MAIPLTVLVQICPDCRRGPLRPVVGGLGRMGRCTRCGYTGPLRHTLGPKNRR